MNYCLIKGQKDGENMDGWTDGWMNGRMDG